MPSALSRWAAPQAAIPLPSTTTRVPSFGSKVITGASGGEHAFVATDLRACQRTELTAGGPPGIPFHDPVQCGVERQGRPPTELYRGLRGVQAQHGRLRWMHSVVGR